jgi:hypothetical protein
MSTSLESKIQRLLILLEKGTREGRLSWEQAAGENEFRVTLGNGLVRVGKRGEGFTLTVLDQGNRVIDEVHVATRTELPRLAEVHQLAREYALNLEGAMDNLLSELERRVGSVSTN